ncbi:helix-turn-helix domain-containing protein [Nocardia niigatensis]
MTTTTLTRTRIRYSKTEAAQMLSISVRTFDRLRAAGKIIGRQDGGRVFFDHDELVSYAKSCEPED